MADATWLRMSSIKPCNKNPELEETNVPEACSFTFCPLESTQSVRWHRWKFNTCLLTRKMARRHTQCRPITHDARHAAKERRTRNNTDKQGEWMAEKIKIETAGFFPLPNFHSIVFNRWNSFIPVSLLYRPEMTQFNRGLYGAAPSSGGWLIGFSGKLVFSGRSFVGNGSRFGMLFMNGIVVGICKVTKWEEWQGGKNIGKFCFWLVDC